MKWNTVLYDQKHAFVSKYGEDLLHLLDPKSGEKILDLGCGTGDLSLLIQKSGAAVMGVDSSPEMIEAAKKKYSEVNFAIQNAENLNFKAEFDAVFSNAVLHWVKDHPAMIKSVHRSLKKAGRFIAEMGGKNNVGQLLHALKQVLEQHGYPEQANKKVWFFPALGEYTYLLEKHGFKVVYAVYYDRPTLLQDNEKGVSQWINTFGSQFLEGIKEEEKQRILQQVTTMLASVYCKDGDWYADYKRLRFVAIKE